MFASYLALQPDLRITIRVEAREPSRSDEYRTLRTAVLEKERELLSDIARLTIRLIDFQAKRKPETLRMPPLPPRASPECLEEGALASVTLSEVRDALHRMEGGDLWQVQRVRTPD